MLLLLISVASAAATVASVSLDPTRWAKVCPSTVTVHVSPEFVGPVSVSVEVVPAVPVAAPPEATEATTFELVAGVIVSSTPFAAIPTTKPSRVRSLASFVATAAGELPVSVCGPSPPSTVHESPLAAGPPSMIVVASCAEASGPAIVSWTAIASVPVPVIVSVPPLLVTVKILNAAASALSVLAVCVSVPPSACIRVSVLVSMAVGMS